ncbi:tetratricopeptide repeat protein [Qipengyuania sp.]|uniref:tetratricopeptide repeat protein n=1 Tax=Qipengyuania sp. TaxID=2004515 RepID=UPI0035C86158
MTASAPHLSISCALAAVGLALAVPSAPTRAQEVVQAIPPREAGELRDAMRRLGSRPNDLDALLSAGNASLALRDPGAAAGFFSRAAAIAPRNARVLLGTARVALAEQRPVTALQLFAQAEAGGIPVLEMAADRGLAYDLVGDNASAQALYNSVLAQGDNAEIRQRLALSLAMSGDRTAFEAALYPLLQMGDRTAFRTRAFGLAILGKPEEAVAIADTMLSTDLALRMAPYLRYMPRLTRAQQAAASNLGTFPAAAEIGRDSADIAGYAARGAQIAARADNSLTPSGPALGAAQVAAPPPARRQRPDRTATSSLPAPSAQPSVPPAPPPASLLPPTGAAPVQVAAARTQELAPVPAPSQAQTQPVVVASAPAPVAPPPLEQVDLAEAFADLGPAPGAPPAASAGAVDISSIKPKREAPPAPPSPPPPPPEPSRIWVQVAVGKDKDALAFDWRRLVRKAGGAITGKGPWIAKYGVSQRMLAGPFPNAEGARDVIKQLKEKEIESLPFTSEAGEKVTKLD